MQTKSKLEAVIEDLNDLKAINVVSLDVRQDTPITDYMVIATGNSSRHVGSLADNLIKKVKERQEHLIGIEGDDDNEWVLVDLGDIVVHIMQPRVRDFYHLEKLWSHAAQKTAAVV